MGRSQETFNKKEKEKKRKKKKQDKLLKREERRANSEGGGLDAMMAYVDEEGRIVDTPPDPAKKSKIKAEDIKLGVPKKEDDDLTVERRGKISFYNDQKGYGFINDSANHEKYFFHINSVEGEIRESDKVTYFLEKGMKGLNAVQVTKV